MPASSESIGGVGRQGKRAHLESMRRLRQPGLVVDLVVCGNCQLKHSAREDQQCPRCGATKSPNPFEAPAAILRTPVVAPPDTGDGRYGLGVALGLVLGLWGLLGCLIFAKPVTKRGAIHGFLGRLGLTVIVVIIALALG